MIHSGTIPGIILPTIMTRGIMVRDGVFLGGVTTTLGGGITDGHTHIAIITAMAGIILYGANIKNGLLP